MSKVFPKRILLSVFAALFTLSGCGDSGPALAPVEGTVNLNGKPIEKIMIEFWPTSSGPRSIAVSDAEGHFKMMTDDGKRDGAAVGPHKVVLHDVGIIDENAPTGRAAENVDIFKGKKPRISAKYSTPETTLILETVKSGKNDFKFDLVKF